MLQDTDARRSCEVRDERDGIEGHTGISLVDSLVLPLHSTWSLNSREMLTGSVFGLVKAL